MRTTVNTIEELKNLMSKNGQLHVADVHFSFDLHPVGEYHTENSNFAYIEYEEGIFELHYSDTASVVYSHDIYYLQNIEEVNYIAEEWTNNKITG